MESKTTTGGTMKFDFTKPVQTRDGIPVRIIATDGHPDWPVVGYVGPNTAPSVWKIDGSFSKKDISVNDLINVQQKRTLDVWVNVYEDGTVGCLRDSKEDSDYHSRNNRTACLHIVREYTEGEGL